MLPNYFYTHTHTHTGTTGNLRFRNDTEKNGEFVVCSAFNLGNVRIKAILSQ